MRSKRKSNTIIQKLAQVRNSARSLTQCPTYRDCREVRGVKTDRGTPPAVSWLVWMARLVKAVSPLNTDASNWVKRLPSSDLA